MSLSTMFSAQVNADAYLGFGIGPSSFKVDLTEFGSSSFDKDSTGTKIYGGYTFNQYFAAELSAYNFSEASVGAIETSPGSGVFVSASTDMKGFSAYAVAMYPVTKKINLSAKAGVVSWDADIIFNNSTVGNNGTDLAYGVAASYAFTKKLFATIEWETFDSDNPEIDMFSVGFKFIID